MWPSPTDTLTLKHYDYVILMIILSSATSNTRCPPDFILTAVQWNSCGSFSYCSVSQQQRASFFHWEDEENNKHFHWKVERFGVIMTFRSSIIPPYANCYRVPFVEFLIPLTQTLYFSIFLPTLARPQFEVRSFSLIFSIQKQNVAFFVILFYCGCKISVLATHDLLWCGQIYSCQPNSQRNIEQ